MESVKDGMESMRSIVWNRNPLRMESIKDGMESMRSIVWNQHAVLYKGAPNFVSANIVRWILASLTAVSSQLLAVSEI